MSIPTSEQLNRRVMLRVRSDASFGDAGIAENYVDVRRLWAKVEPIHGLAIRYGAQISDVPTHLFWIRYTPQTRPDDIGINHIFDWNGRRYRVLDAINVEDRQRFTRVSVKDIGVING